LGWAVTQGDDIGVAVALTFNRKDAEICEGSRIDLLVDRLQALVDGQPDLNEVPEPTA
jgi:hypothetical protein